MGSRDDLAIMAMLVDTWDKDPWKWIRDCLVTIDEADGGRLKPFPDKAYLKHTVKVWQRETVLAIPKSRRMMMTWLMIALHLHAALFRPNSAIFVQSKKTEDSEFLLGNKRFLHLYSTLQNAKYNLPWPKVVRPQKWRERDFVDYIAFDNGSYVKAIGQGADQMRQYTASHVYCTEMAFWEWAKDSWGALKPTIQGGGKITIDSSAGPGFYQQIVEGNI